MLVLKTCTHQFPVLKPLVERGKKSGNAPSFEARLLFFETNKQFHLRT